MVGDTCRNICIEIKITINTIIYPKMDKLQEIFPRCLIPIILEYNKPYAITFDGHIFIDLVGGNTYPMVNVASEVNKIILIPECNRYVIHKDAGLAVGQLSPPKDAKDVMDYDIQYPLVYHYSHRKIYSIHELLVYDMIDDISYYLSFFGILTFYARPLHIVCVSNDDEYILLNSFHLTKRDPTNHHKYNVIGTVDGRCDFVDSTSLFGSYIYHDIVKNKTETTNLIPLGFLGDRMVAKTTHSNNLFIYDKNKGKCTSIPIPNENILSCRCHFNKFIITYTNKIYIYILDASLRYSVLQKLNNFCFLC